MNFLFSILLSQPHRTKWHSSFIIFLLKCTVTTTLSLIWKILFSRSSLSHVFCLTQDQKRSWNSKYLIQLVNVSDFLSPSLEHNFFTHFYLFRPGCSVLLVTLSLGEGHHNPCNEVYFILLSWKKCLPVFVFASSSLFPSSLVQLLESEKFIEKLETFSLQQTLPASQR